MTIAIGIKCSDGVVVACDSQSEYERGVDVKWSEPLKLGTKG
jgi:20S proteasome alpha/beta subunit